MRESEGKCPLVLPVHLFNFDSCRITVLDIFWCVFFFFLYHFIFCIVFCCCCLLLFFLLVVNMDKL